MNLSTVKKYSLNCFLLTIPILIWNLLFACELPHAFQNEVFWKDIPLFLSLSESSLRVGLLILALLMPLRIKTRSQKRGLVLYLCGTTLYFASWLVLIYFPESWWSDSMIGFMAPAYTPLLWLTGIGLIGDTFYFNLCFRRWIFFSIAIAFLALHNLHALTIYFRIH